MVCEPVLVTDRPVLLHFALLESPLWIGGWEGGLLSADAQGVEPRWLCTHSGRFHYL